MHSCVGGIGGILPLGFPEELVELDRATSDPAKSVVLSETQEPRRTASADSQSNVAVTDDIEAQ